MKGTRVQSVVQELRGEKIDIVHWISDQAEYVCRALAPAKVAKIIIDDDDHTMEVIVPDDQLSLAIGKKGQNVRLASRLTGWRIDVRSEAEADEETRKARQSISSIPGIGDMAAELIYQAGFKSAEDVADSPVEEILDIEGISKEKAEVIHNSAKQYIAEKRAKEAELAANPAPAPVTEAAATGDVVQEGES
jgi:N utilization substance protein A